MYVPVNVMWITIYNVFVWWLMAVANNWIKANRDTDTCHNSEHNLFASPCTRCVCFLDPIPINTVLHVQHFTFVFMSTLAWRNLTYWFAMTNLSYQYRDFDLRDRITWGPPHIIIDTVELIFANRAMQCGIYIFRASSTNMDSIWSQHGQVITSIKKCRMRFLIHSQTSTVLPMKFGNG